MTAPPEVCAAPHPGQLPDVAQAVTTSSTAASARFTVASGLSTVWLNARVMTSISRPNAAAPLTTADATRPARASRRPGCRRVAQAEIAARPAAATTTPFRPTGNGVSAR
ncbi:hypothetical protein [Actinoplanes sp. L3-i22]|uniref:hypothetical protein n=1 Tax=Actinoplanes sp. L3-i22 TaxID=2836373 RepID=UPI001C782B26|nr:hypothetical protein [Actinoplanes sp. L3-i22]BCY10555.1 hypothetical protein L3i22_056430 [Actinoplanes sp. L3-i22]